MSRKIYTPMDPGKAAFLNFLAILFPPLAVAMAEGCTADVGINTLCWIFGVIPGWIHAFYIISCRVRGPIIPLSFHQSQLPSQTPSHPTTHGYNNNPGSLESQLEAQIMAPMKAGRIPDGVVLHIAPSSPTSTVRGAGVPVPPPRGVPAGLGYDPRAFEQGYTHRDGPAPEYAFASPTAHQQGSRKNASG